MTLHGITGTGNTTVVKASNGANVYIKSDCTITGTTEILLDGVAKTFAEMRANTPKYLTNATTGTRVWGD